MRAGPWVGPGRRRLGGGDSLAAAGGLLHLVTAQATRADVEVLHAAIHQRPDPLQIGIPLALGGIVRVADRVSRHSPFAADITTLSHDLPPVEAGTRPARRNGRAV